MSTVNDCKACSGFYPYHTCGRLPKEPSVMEAARPALADEIKDLETAEWVCHVTGSDDVIDCESEIEALITANEINKATTNTVRSEHDPVVIAVAKMKTEL